MTDREKLLIALLRESDRRAGADISVVDVIEMLERLGAEHQQVVHHKLVAYGRVRVGPSGVRPEADQIITTGSRPGRRGATMPSVRSDPSR